MSSKCPCCPKPPIRSYAASITSGALPAGPSRGSASNCSNICFSTIFTVTSFSFSNFVFMLSMYSLYVSSTDTVSTFLPSALAGFFELEQAARPIARNDAANMANPFLKRTISFPPSIYETITIVLSYRKRLQQLSICYR
nr:hypothetical protein NRS6085_02157 [Bacillus subtilis]